MTSLVVALGMALGLLVGLPVREYAKARVADRLGDAGPRLHGRLTLNPRALVDPLGTLIIPGILLFLVATGQGFLPVFAYAKPLPISTERLRDERRDPLLLAFAGPAASLALSVVAGVVLRLAPEGDPGLIAFGFLWANLMLFAFNLMPIPGLDGSLWLRHLLRGRAREVYGNLDPYLPLFILVIFFIFGSPLLAVVEAIANSVCRVVTGSACVG